ncbi:hypothetical protein MATL_G00190910 [Megalops atlanticus]|uniref:Cilia- and flagella-associated protein 43 n=1 Tax=Megalops atlanticus TaxID=7932 RepID=A0A9D3PL63_MEGAT|nr:hypothetical protein MATL_G00190910 [Megalops atlanticus]
MDNLGTLEVRWAQGLTSQNVEFVDNKTACYTCGNYIVFLNVESKKRSIMLSPGRGVGAFTANGHRQMLAFSEQKPDPSIFVYSYPELVLKNELKGTAKLEYTSLALSRAGPYLACFSSVPDHTVTIWNWESGAVLCSRPTGGKEISNLMFNPTNWQQLCATAASSVTVWNVEMCGELHIMTTSMISLPAADGSMFEAEAKPSQGHIETLDYDGPKMPVSAIAGLTRDEAHGFVPKEKMKAELCPSSMRWTASSDLYVGCSMGHLLQVNPDTQAVSILLNPQNPGDLADNDQRLQQGGVQSMAVSKEGLFAAGNDGILRCLQIKGNYVEITDLWDIGEPVTYTAFSPDCEMMLLSSTNGRIYSYTSDQPEKGDKVLDVLSGDFVAASPLYTDKKNLCVSLRDSGELQLWSIDDESCISSISLQTQVTCLACCPSAHYVAVGTVSGHVLFVDLTREEGPRVIHRLHLYHVPVEHLSFDQGGNFLITGASDSNIFVLDARPSKMFGIFGYTEAAGAIVDLSTQYCKDSKQVKVLALCAGKEEEPLKEGTRLVLFSLPIKQLTGAVECADLHGCLSNDLLQKYHCEVTHPLSSAVLGPKNNIYGYSNKTKTLQRLQVPKGKESSTPAAMVKLTPEQEVEGHPLGPVSLLLSPHQLWLTSVGKDGLLRIRETSSIEKYVEMRCHACWLGGVQTVAFGPDGQTLITTGHKDGSMVCMQLRLNARSKADEATRYGRAMLAALESSRSTESPALSQLPAWTPPAQPQDESYTSCSSAVPSDPTWLDNKHQEAIKKESEQYAGAKNSLRKDIRQLRETIQAMMRENETLPDMEKLEPQEFNLDIDQQKRLQAEGDEEVNKVRNETELENLAKSYLCEVIKKECWDSMKVKGQAIKAFHSEHEVKNYPMKARLPREQEELERVHSMRQIELADEKLQKEIFGKKMNSPGVEEEEDEEEERAESAALSGSLSAWFGCCDPYLHTQFDLHVREQKINQITMLQDVIFKIKSTFNKEFEAVYKQKEQEINRVRDKNRRITEIMAELEVKEELWEPALSDSERPERALTVLDSEIKVEKYLTPEQKLKAEELRKAEEQRRLAAKGDNIRERALDDMMGGVLEMKKEDILKMEVPQPEFMSRPMVEWTEDDKKNFKEYEKKAKELSEEQEKHRKALETEMKKLQSSIKEATQVFDEVLTRLFERKVISEMVIYQEELKIANLVHSLLMEEEIHNREKELSHRLDKSMALKNDIEEELDKYKEIVDAFREIYDTAVVEDKLLDRGFRREFPDVPCLLVDQLYKLYKRRPRVPRMRTQTDSSSCRERPPSGRGTSEGQSLMMKAMAELDDPANMPEELDPAMWKRFCLARRAKVESEQLVKERALTLAEMQAFLQRRIDEDDAIKLKIKEIMAELNSLREEKMVFQLDLMVQILLKQGQVEVETGRFVADFSDSELLHRSMVEDLNATIRALGDHKIATMVEIKDFRKGIIQQEWENKRMSMQIEDLTNKARDIQMLRVTLELQEYLSTTDHDKRRQKQASNVEKNMTLQEKTHRKDVRNTKKLIDELARQAAHKAEQNIHLDEQIASLKVTVAERTLICEAIAMEESQHSSGEERYHDIVERKKLMDLAKAQAEELTELRAEVERMRMRTFPALTHLKYD